jgi:hypothetical protein
LGCYRFAHDAYVAYVAKQNTPADEKEGISSQEPLLGMIADADNVIQSTGGEKSNRNRNNV